VTTLENPHLKIPRKWVMWFIDFNQINGVFLQCDTILCYTAFGMAMYITELLFTLSIIVKAEKALQ